MPELTSVTTLCRSEILSAKKTHRKVVNKVFTVAKGYSVIEQRIIDNVRKTE